MRSPPIDETPAPIDTVPLAGQSQGRPTELADPDDSRAALRSEEVLQTSGAVVGVLDVRAIVEERHQNLMMFRRAPVVAGNVDCV